MYCQKTIDEYNNSANQKKEAGAYPPWENFLLPYLKPGDHILDLGCGDGHYGSIFQQLGYKVSGIDASASLCQIATKKLGVLVRNLRFDQLSDMNLYNAVWACCSLLHIPRQAMTDAFSRISFALKSSGYVYASFMEGEHEGWRDQLGSYMADMTEKSMQMVLSFVPSLQIIEVHRTPCLYKKGTSWIHFLLKK